VFFVKFDSKCCSGFSYRNQFQGWSGGAKPLHLRRRRNPHHIPSKFPAHSAPERAVVVLCANKNDFREQSHKTLDFFRHIGYNDSNSTAALFAVFFRKAELICKCMISFKKPDDRSH
jgi:hypothetical protein